MKKILTYIFLFALIILPAYTPTVVSAATCYNINYNAKFGMKDGTSSNNVSVVQAFLREYNFLAPGPSGYFGPSTLAAVKRFQTTYNISPAVGFVGNLTREKIKQVSCSGYNPITQPVTGKTVRYSQNSLSIQTIYNGKNIIYRYTVTAPDNASVSIPSETVFISQSGVQTANLKMQVSTNDYFDTSYIESSVVSDSSFNTSNYVSKNVQFNFYPNIVIPAGQTRYFQVVQEVTSRTTSGTVIVSHAKLGTERLYASATSNDTGSISLTTLNSGETLTKGTAYTIRWSTSDFDYNKNITLSLVNTDGTTYSITTVPGSSTGQGEYVWTIPNSITAKGGYRIRVTNGYASDVNDLVFAIREGAPTITVTAPTAGEVWNLDSTATRRISWTYTGIESSRTATIYLVFPDNTQCSIGTTNIGAETITGSIRSNSCIGATKTITPGTYRIAVAATTASGVSVTDYTDNTFTLITDAINPSLMAITSPNGGQSLTVTQDTTITWTTPTGITSTDLVTLNLDVYTNTGTSPYKTIPIVTSLKNTKSYTWDVPTTLSGSAYVSTDRYKVTVIAQKNTSLRDSSDEFFSINALQRVVSITGPTQTSIPRDTDVTVSWNKTGFLTTDKLHIAIVPVGSASQTVIKSNVSVSDGSTVVRIPLATSLNSYRIKLIPVSYTFGADSVVTGSLFALTNKTGYSISPTSIAGTLYKGDYVTAGWSSNGLTGSSITVRLVTSDGSPVAGVSSISASISSGQKDILIPATLPTGTYKILFEGVSDGNTVTAFSNTFTVTDPVYTFTLNGTPTSAVRNSTVDIGWSSTRTRTGDTVAIRIVDSAGNSLTKNTTIGAQDVSIQIPNTFVSGTATIYATSTAVGYTRGVLTSSRTLSITNPILPSITITGPSANSTSTGSITASWQNNNFASAVSPITTLRVSVIQKKGSTTNTSVIESGLSPSVTSLFIPLAANGALGTLRNVGIDLAFDYQIKVDAMAGSSVATSTVSTGAFKVKQ